MQSRLLSKRDLRVTSLLVVFTLWAISRPSIMGMLGASAIRTAAARLAEPAGYEPTDDGEPPEVFKTSALNRSATTPGPVLVKTIFHGCEQFAAARARERALRHKGDLRGPRSAHPTPSSTTRRLRPWFASPRPRLLGRCWCRSCAARPCRIRAILQAAVDGVPPTAGGKAKRSTVSFGCASASGAFSTATD